MIAVIFEATPTPGQGRDAYLSIAASLAADLHGVSGFLTVERF